MSNELPNRPYRQHLASAESLQTRYAAYRAGFVSLAIERNRRASPFVDEARKLKAIASNARTPAELLRIDVIRNALLTAAGVSDKAARHLEESDKTDAIVGLIGTYLEPAGDNFVEELVYRFLLTRGDALGGTMRNVGGVLAQRKLTRSIITCLNLIGFTYWWTDKQRIVWKNGESSLEDADIELTVSGLSWQNTHGQRTLLYNLTVPAVKNNVDMCLFDSSHTALTKDTLKDASRYIALGELKGGIDPAGSDEHWKTAKSALERIRQGFTDHHPATFFIGAAIEKKMASELWELLETGTLTNAANLTDEDHVTSIALWLCRL